MAKPGNRHVVVADIGKPRGLSGEVRVRSFMEDPAALGAYGALSASGGQSLTVKSARPEKGVVIVRFAEITTREDAEALQGQTLSVPRSRMPAADDDEFYHDDLLGLSVVTQSGDQLGAIRAVHDFGSGDLLEITGPGRPSIMLPFTKAVVPTVDLASGRVIVDPPEGLLDDGDDDGDGQSDRRDDAP